MTLDPLVVARDAVRSSEFVVTDDHRKLLPHICMSYNDDCEFGAPAVDPHCPYGDSNVLLDMAEILGSRWKADEEALKRLHAEMTVVIEIALHLTGLGLVMTPGTYGRRGGLWVKK